ncbi:MAG TPA: hypothetical protein VEG32_08080 [Clostridia bacterium]|nr:hypothetical protein [Clostridia bacterium]
MAIESLLNALAFAVEVKPAGAADESLLAGVVPVALAVEVKALLRRGAAAHEPG